MVNFLSQKTDGFSMRTNCDGFSISKNCDRFSFRTICNGFSIGKSYGEFVMRILMENTPQRSFVRGFWLVCQIFFKYPPQIPPKYPPNTPNGGMLKLTGGYFGGRGYLGGMGVLVA